MIESGPGGCRDDASAPGNGPPLWLILAQLVLIGLALTWLDVLPETFRYLVVASFGAFVVHHALPDRYRLDFFVGLGVASVLFVMGTTIQDEDSRGWSIAAALSGGLPILVVAVTLIATCRLRIGFWTRVGLLVAAGTAVALAREGTLPLGAPRMAWLILGGLFALRIFVYLYDASTAVARPGWRESLAYFLVPPNVCTPVFPALDFKTFCRSHFAEPPRLTYQRGVERMVKGALQLVVLRYVYILYISPERVYSGSTLVVSVVSESLLYLWVSGHFHLVTGLLHLFGFRLPETHVRYFLAESVADYWRRANVYFRDLMVKVFYRPMFAHGRRRGLSPEVAVALATFAVFPISWVVRLFLTWWSEGRIAFTWTDFTFWVVLGGLVAGQAVRDFVRPPQRPHSPHRAIVANLALCARTAATFCFIAVLYSMSQTPTFSVWFGMWNHADLSALVLALGVFCGVGCAKLLLEIAPALPRVAPVMTRWRPARLAPVASMTFLLALPYLTGPARSLAISWPTVDPRFSPAVLADVVEDGASAPRPAVTLGEVDDARREFDEVQLGRRLGQGGLAGTSVVAVGDYRLHRLRPNLTDEPAFGTTITTNSHGMRDEEPPRSDAGGPTVALLGADDVLGWGVTDDATLARQLEARFSVSAGGHSTTHVDIMNFGVYGYGLLSQVPVLTNEVVAFEPDIVVVVGGLEDGIRSVHALQTHLRRHRGVPDPALEAILDEARVTPDTRYPVAALRLAPARRAIKRWSLERIAEEAGAASATAVYAFLPAPADLPLSPDHRTRAEWMMATAADVGMHVIDLTDASESVASGDEARSRTLTPAGHSAAATALHERLRPLVDAIERK